MTKNKMIQKKSNNSSQNYIDNSINNSFNFFTSTVSVNSNNGSKQSSDGSGENLVIIISCISFIFLMVKFNFLISKYQEYSWISYSLIILLGLIEFIFVFKKTKEKNKHYGVVIQSIIGLGIQFYFQSFKIPKPVSDFVQVIGNNNNNILSGIFQNFQYGPAIYIIVFALVFAIFVFMIFGNFYQILFRKTLFSWFNTLIPLVFILAFIFFGNSILSLPL